MRHDTMSVDPWTQAQIRNHQVVALLRSEGSSPNIERPSLPRPRL
jgi:hypothetical protein